MPRAEQDGCPCSVPGPRATGYEVSRSPNLNLTIRENDRGSAKDILKKQDIEAVAITNSGLPEPANQRSEFNELAFNAGGEAYLVGISTVKEFNQRIFDVLDTW
jgi:hypothetical protein